MCESKEQWLEVSVLLWPVVRGLALHLLGGLVERDKQRKSNRCS